MATTLYDENGNEVDLDAYLASQDANENDSNVTMKRSAIRALEASSKTGKDAQTELLQLRRRIAIADAGIPRTKIGDLFMKAYDGPVDDLEAIRKAAQEYGIIQPAAQGEQSQEAGAAKNISDASSGAENNGTREPVDFSKANSEAEVLEMLRSAGGSVPTD